MHHSLLWVNTEGQQQLQGATSLMCTVIKDPYQIIGEAVVHAKTLLIDQRAHNKLRQTEPKWLLSPPVGPIESPDLGGEAACFLPINNKHSDPQVNKKGVTWLYSGPADIHDARITGCLLRLWKGCSYGAQFNCLKETQSWACSQPGSCVQARGRTDRQGCEGTASPYRLSSGELLCGPF